MRLLLIALPLVLALAAGPAFAKTTALDPASGTLVSQAGAQAMNPDASSLLPNPETAPVLEGYEDGDWDDEEIWDSGGNEVRGEDSAMDAAARVPDPLEPWNRFWFTFNDKMYVYVMEPVAKGWKWAVPELPRHGVRNFFHNLAAPVRFVNCLLQGKFFKAGVEMSRFIGNTAFGFGGLVDVTGDLKPTRPIPPGEEDFGQTLGMWGIGNGIYLVWPIFGPSSLRDTVGLAGDMSLDPGWFVATPAWYWSVAAKSGQKINDVSFKIGEYDALKKATFDPYISFRDAYLRYRAQKVEE